MLMCKKQMKITLFCYLSVGILDFSTQLSLSYYNSTSFAMI